MKIARDVREYLFRNELEIRIYLDKVNIVNYKKLGDITDTSISIYHDKGKVTVVGKKLVLSRLLNNEILIMGDINTSFIGIHFA